MAQNLDVYQIVTDRIIEKLENGVIPWHKPWSASGNLAYNRITKKPYSFLNQLLLSNTGEYASFKQWQQLGGHIKKGAKAEIVTFWKLAEYQDKDILITNEDGTQEFGSYIVPLLKYYNVFHISQVEGVESKEVINHYDHEPIKEAEIVINNYLKDGVKVNYGGNEAFYRRITDSVQMPAMESFKEIEEYYSTFFHELSHSTKHQKRLNRGNETINKFGSGNYSKEELVAEISATNILNILGFETENTFNNSSAYIQNWLEVLKNDKRFIVSASSQAQKASEYILKFSKDEDFIKALDMEAEQC